MCAIGDISTANITVPSLALVKSRTAKGFKPQAMKKKYLKGED